MKSVPVVLYRREGKRSGRREAHRSAEMLLSAAFRVVLVYTRVKLKQRFAVICTKKTTRWGEPADESAATESKPAAVVAKIPTLVIAPGVKLPMSGLGTWQYVTLNINIIFSVARMSATRRAEG